MGNFIEDANWRYATKKFDTTKKVSAENLEILKKAISLTATSYGLEPYKVLIIENQDIKNELVSASWGQQIVADASHLIVFANILDFGPEQMNEYFKNVVKTRNVPMEALQGYSDFMQSSVNALSLEKRNSWTAKQTYLAMNNLLNACAELKIDATPMEGIVPEKYNEILGLNKLGLNAVLATPIGYRHADDATQFYKKVRKSANDLFITI